MARQNARLGFTKTILLSLLGFIGIAVVFGYFREGVLFKNQVFNLEENFIYKMVLLLFLFVSILTALHLLALSFGIKKKSRKISSLNSPEQIMEFMKSSKGWGSDIWDAYSATMPSDKKRKTRADADLYFNPEDIVSKSFFKLPALEFLRNIPSTFIGLGILGTFIGFTNAIPDSSNFSSIEELKPLLSGLKVAFNTSIFGILGSVIYNFFITQPIILALENDSRELSDLFDMTFYISDVKILEHLEQTIKEGRDDYTNKIKEATTALTGISQILEQTPQKLIDANRVLENSVENICEKTKEQLDTTVTMIRTTLSEELNKVVQSFDGSSRIIKESSENIRSVSDGMINIQDKLENVVNQSRIYLEQCYNAVETKVIEELGSLFAAMNVQCQSSIDGALQTVSDVIRVSFADTQERVNKTIASFENTATGNLAHLFDEIKSLVAKEATNISKEVVSSITALIDENRKLLSCEIENVNSYINSLEDTLSNVAEKTKTIPSEIDHIYEKLSMIPRDLDKLQKEFIGSSEKLINASGLAESIEKIRELNDSFLKREGTLTSLLHQSGEKFKGVSDSVVNVSSNMKDISDKMEESRRKIDSANVAMRQAIDEILKVKSNEEIKNILSAILDTISQKTKVELVSNEEKE